MPLPADNAPWPPHDTATANRFRTYDAWYSGLPDRLGKAYQNQGATRNRPSQSSGGIVGVISRMFWGAPTPAGETRAKIHVPLPADIATASSDLLFAKPPTLKFTAPASQTRWDALAAQVKLSSRLHEAAEVQSAFGGVFLRGGYDTELAPHPLLTTVHADRAIPEFRWNRLVAVTFWYELENDGNKVVRYLQRHEMVDGFAVELHAVYVGTIDRLGVRKNLDYHDVTKGQKDAVEDKLPVLPVVHVPNMLPSREDRSNELGRSDFEGITQAFDQVDETMTSWMRDIRLAKARIIAPTAYLQNLGPGQGAGFDIDREVYEALDIPPTNTSVGITLQQFEIRVDEHDRSMARFIRQAVGTAGYSASTFGLEEAGGGGEQTATEVTDRRNRSVLTREKKTAYWTTGLQEIATALVHIDRLFFRGTVDPADVPVVRWPDATGTDQLKLAQTVQAWDVARAASTEVKVRAIHPDWEDKAITAEVGRIQAEVGEPIADPLDVRPPGSQDQDPAADEDPEDDAE